MTINWQRFAEIVNSNQKFLLTSHIRPDCDAVGSELGMAGVLEALGKDVMIVNGHATPPNIAFIDPDNKIKAIGQDIHRDDLQDIDVLMVLDTSAWIQLGDMAAVVKETKAKKLIFDHHVSEDDLGAELFKNTTACATGRMVLEAAEHLGVTLTPEIASPLFAAVATDTGWFRFPSAGVVAYEAGARLIAGGANPAAIYGALYEQDTLPRVQLRGIILSRITAELDGRLAHTYVMREDFEQTGAHGSDTEDVINMALAIAGTEFAVILIEQEGGYFKVSFRSRCDLNCSEVAAHFGGGGHKAAAGASVRGELSQVQPHVLDHVRSLMR